MPLEIGKVVDGTVTGITNFGAFIQLPDGNTGLCHISEIADEYVKNVKDYLKEQQVVKVKVIEMNGKGKVSLSIRKAQETDTKKPEIKPEAQKIQVRQKHTKPQDMHGSRLQGSRSKAPRPPGFEDMLSKFLKDSDEKLKTIKKRAINRRGSGFNRSGD